MTLLSSIAASICIGLALIICLLPVISSSLWTHPVNFVGTLLPTVLQLLLCRFQSCPISSPFLSVQNSCYHFPVLLMENGIKNVHINNLERILKMNRLDPFFKMC